MTRLTLSEENLLLTFNDVTPTEADFESVQCLTSKHLLSCVSDSPYMWLLSEEGQLTKETIQAERARNRRDEERYQREEQRAEKEIKLGVYGFYISLASLLLAVLAFVCSLR